MKLFAILFCLLTSVFSHAKRDIYPFEKVAGLSDLIVVGFIEEVDLNTYTFKITETLKGDVHASIRVEKFVETEFDIRYASHEKGQKLCLFLKKGLLSWSIINGSTGERPILDQTIYLGIDGNYKLPLTEFSKVIHKFNDIYDPKVEVTAYNERVSFIQKCSDEELRNFKSEGKFSHWLCNQINPELTSQE